MNIYKVPFIFKNGGYTPPDMVSSGGYYDIARYEIVTATTKKAAQAAVAAAHKGAVVRRAILLGPA